MPSKSLDLKPRLFHIRDNIIYTQELLSGSAYDEFKQSRTLFYATTRALEIISEASRRLPAALKARHPHIPWTDVAGAGSVYRHDYEDVQEHRVWITVHTYLPPLLAVVVEELGALGELP
jgi:uncharacterized protein with HEPN domain